MDGYARRKQQKEQRIFEEAFYLFSEHSYAKVSVNEVAQRANVSPATIYNYYQTKENLYTQMLLAWMGKQLFHYEQILQSDLPFAQKTREILLREAQNIHLFSQRLPSSPVSEEVELYDKVMKQLRQALANFFLRYIKLGKQAGEINSELTDETAMLYFNMYSNELSRHWLPSHVMDSQRIEELLGLFFYGVAGQAPK